VLKVATFGLEASSCAPLLDRIVNNLLVKFIPYSLDSLDTLVKFIPYGLDSLDTLAQRAAHQHC